VEGFHADNLRVGYHYFAAKELYNSHSHYYAAYVFLGVWKSFFFFPRRRLLRVQDSSMLFRLNSSSFHVSVMIESRGAYYVLSAAHFLLLVVTRRSSEVIVELFLSNFLHQNGVAFTFSLLGLSSAQLSPLCFQLLFAYWPLHVIRVEILPFTQWFFRSNFDHFVVLVGMTAGFRLPSSRGLSALDNGSAIVHAAEPNPRREMAKLKDAEEGIAADANWRFPALRGRVVDAVPLHHSRLRWWAGDGKQDFLYASSLSFCALSCRRDRITKQRNAKSPVERLVAYQRGKYAKVAIPK